MNKKIINFLKDEIWTINTEDLPVMRAVFVKSLKILMLAGLGFNDDKCTLRASALTLYTLLSIVPIFAMLFGIAKGFGFEKTLKDRLLEQVPEQDTMILQLIGFAENLLANTQGGVVAGIGVAVLFWTVIKVISNIEESFNHIWKIEKGRDWGRKVSDYLSLMLLAPILLIASNSITVFVRTQITGLATSIQIPEFGTSMIFYVLSYLPMVIMWILFTFTFIFMPNTKVSLKSGLIAGVITGTAYQLLQWGYVSLQVGVSSYNAIYGSFAALPLFLIWLQLGWLIVLFGAEISHIHQHFSNYRHKNRYSNLSFSSKKMVALQIVHLIVGRFTKAEKSPTVEEIADQLIMPESVVREILFELKQSHIVVEIKTDDEAIVFQPGCDTSLMTVAYVLEALDRRGDNILLGAGPVEPLTEINQAFSQKINSAQENRLLKEI